MIRGWLILVGLGFFLFPLRVVDFLWGDLRPAFSKEVWPLLTTPGNPAYHPLNAPVLMFELAGNVLLLACAIGLVALFVQRRRRFPPVAMLVLAAALLFYIADYFVAHQIPAVAEQAEMDSTADILEAFLACAIVIPYLRLSTRVKETFVR